MAEFTPINTQEEFDALIKDRIDRAKESARKEFSDYEQIKTSLSEKDAEIGKLKESAAAAKAQIDDLSAKLSASETASAKTRIALEEGLPFELHDRLNGSTEDEIRADAKALAELIKVPKQTAPLFTPGDNKTEGDKALLGLMEKLK